MENVCYHVWLEPNQTIRPIRAAVLPRTNNTGLGEGIIRGAICHRPRRGNYKRCHLSQHWQKSCTYWHSLLNVRSGFHAGTTGIVKESCFLKVTSNKMKAQILGILEWRSYTFQDFSAACSSVARSSCKITIFCFSRSSRRRASWRQSEEIGLSKVRKRYRKHLQNCRPTYSAVLLMRLSVTSEQPSPKEAWRHWW